MARLESHDLRVPHAGQRDDLETRDGFPTSVLTFDPLLERDEHALDRLR